MLAVRLPEEIQARLTALAERTGRSKSFSSARPSASIWPTSRTITWRSSGSRSVCRPSRSRRWSAGLVWRIEFEPRALNELEAQDRLVQCRLLAFLRDRIAHLADPRELGEALRGPELGRLWKYGVGDWRLVCDIRDRQVTVVVVRLGHRRELYGR